MFDVQRYSLHNGPGIRTTVFLKGCPLRCAWCHNPEGLEFFRELAVRPELCVAGCRFCEAACPRGAVRAGEGGPSVDCGRCAACFACAGACPTGALEAVGRETTAAALWSEIAPDTPFFSQSGGGVTFSGGEPLSQVEFLLAALKECRKGGVHTAVDTCGHADEAALVEVAAWADVFLYDLKAMDDSRHRELTGCGNGLVLRNMEALVRLGANVVARVPLLAGVNDGERDMNETGAFLRDVGVWDVSLLPYHGFSRSKLGGVKQTTGDRVPVGGFRTPSPREIERCSNILESYGLRVRTGG